MFNSPNYKIVVYFALQTDLLMTFVTVLDTGVGSNCVCYEDLPPAWLVSFVKGPLFIVNDANRKPLDTLGKISLFARAVPAAVKTELVVCQKLSIPFILFKISIDKNLLNIEIVHQRMVILKGCSAPIIRRCRNFLSIRSHITTHAKNFVSARRGSVTHPNRKKATYTYHKLNRG